MDPISGCIVVNIHDVRMRMNLLNSNNFIAEKVVVMLSEIVVPNETPGQRIIIFLVRTPECREVSRVASDRQISGDQNRHCPYLIQSAPTYIATKVNNGRAVECY